MNQHYSQQPQQEQQQPPVPSRTKRQRPRKMKLMAFQCCCSFFFGVFLQGWYSNNFMLRTINEHKQPDEDGSNDARNNDGNNNIVVNFVFTVGLEGTGHHLMGTILQKSPTLTRLKTTYQINQYRNQLHAKLWQTPKFEMTRLRPKLKKDIDRYHRSINNMLNATTTATTSSSLSSHHRHRNRKLAYKGGWNNFEYKGLWDIHCRGSALETMTKSNDVVDTQSISQDLIRLLRKIRDKILQEQQRSKKTSNSANQQQQAPVVYYPINTISGENGYGQVSYPNFITTCRWLAYPSLDLWYDSVCSQVQGIRCSHVYLYRPPIQILESTTIKRKFNPTMMYSLYLYEMLLHIMSSQIVDDTGSIDNHGSSRTVGCYGLYTPEAKQEWMDGIRQIGGWNDDEIDVFEKYINSIYKPPKSTIEGEKTKAEKLIFEDDPSIQLYYNQVEKLHNRVIRLCKSAVEEHDQ